MHSGDPEGHRSGLGIGEVEEAGFNFGTVEVVETAPDGWSRGHARGGVEGVVLAEPAFIEDMVDRPAPGTAKRLPIVLDPTPPHRITAVKAPRLSAYFLFNGLGHDYSGTGELGRNGRKSGSLGTR
jgi:hypothetical protein